MSFLLHSTWLYDFMHLKNWFCFQYFDAVCQLCWNFTWSCILSLYCELNAGRRVSILNPHAATPFLYLYVPIGHKLDLTRRLFYLMVDTVRWCYGDAWLAGSVMWHLFTFTLVGWKQQTGGSFDGLMLALVKRTVYG